MTTFTKREILKNYTDGDKDSAVHYILNKLNIEIETLESDDLNTLRRSVTTLLSRKKDKLAAANRKTERFEKQSKEWLDSTFVVPNLREKCQTFSRKRGRPNVDFSDMSNRSKRREITNISNYLKNDPFKILQAGCYAAKKNKMLDLKGILNKIVSNHENIADMKQSFQACKIRVKSAEEALSFSFR